jgi:thiamine biosynthesis lipoprotein
MLPEGSGLDLGGIGKGWAADRMAAIIRAPCLVNAGGDVFAAGKPEHGDGWLVGVEDPFEPERDLLVLSVCDEGVATSSSLRRRWFDGQRWSHHLIDPRGGGPSTSDAVQVTVIAPSATLADYHAKVTLLLGMEAGLRYLNQEADVEGLIVAADRSLRLSAAFESYVVQPGVATTVA